MKKRNNIFSAFLNKLTETKENNFAHIKEENYTSLVNDFKARLELQ